jgi:hypothetical protein
MSGVYPDYRAPIGATLATGCHTFALPARLPADLNGIDYQTVGNSNPQLSRDCAGCI